MKLDTELLFEPDDEVLSDACMTFRHDFGLLSIEDQKKLMFQAKEWSRALANAVVIKQMKEEKGNRNGQG